MAKQKPIDQNINQEFISKKDFSPFLAYIYFGSINCVIRLRMALPVFETYLVPQYAIWKKCEKT